MDKEKLFNMQNFFGKSVHQLSLKNILNLIEKDDLTIDTNSNEEDVPMDITIYKFIKGLPIILMIASKRTDKLRRYVIKGNKELLNLIKWVKEDVKVTIEDTQAGFKDFNEKNREYLLEEIYPIVAIYVSDRIDKDVPELTLEELKDVIEFYC